DYQGIKQGLALSPEACEPLYSALAHQDAINMILFSDREANPGDVAPAHPATSEVKALILRQSRVGRSHESLVNKTDDISRILRELIEKPLGIQCASLISSEGQPLTPLVGMDANSASIVSGTMLYLSKRTREELQWQEITKVCLQSKDGYVILLQCSPDIFLLIQAGQMLTGLLDGVINRAAQKLQAVLHSNESNVAMFPDQAAILAERNSRHLAAV
ncbi:MAG: hypothetical protein WA902_15760, partial [Thermosynechococcaceae cyanobacterium]